MSEHDSFQPGIHDMVEFKDKPTPDYRAMADTVLRNEYSKLREAQKKAGIDTLTGLRLRAKFLEDAERVQQRAAGNKSKTVALLADVNKFKAINDSEGHPGGDLHLKNTARALEHAMRSGDITGRWGGDEFVALLEVPAEFDEKTLVPLQQRLKDDINGTVKELSGKSDAVSVGLAFVDRSIEEAIELADQQMYVDKKAKRQSAA